MTDIAFPPWAQMTDERREHARRVALLLRMWGAGMDIDGDEADRWIRAACLHDAVKDAPISWLRERVYDPWNIAALLHGPAAAQLAAAHGETDAGILQAVRYHSVGYDGWDQVGQMLYVADFLEPGREMPRRPWDKVRQEVSADPQAALRAVATARVGFLIERGMSLLPETVAFWNRLCPGA